jgi:hypothetical protein
MNIKESGIIVQRGCQELASWSCKIKISSLLNLLQEKKIGAWKFIEVLRRENSVGEIQLLSIIETRYD